MSTSILSDDNDESPLLMAFSGSRLTDQNVKSEYSVHTDCERISPVNIDMLNENVKNNDKLSSDSIVRPLLNGKSKKDLGSRQNSSRTLGRSLSNISYGSIGSASDGRVRRQTSMLMRLSVSEVNEPITLTWRDINVYAPPPRSIFQSCQKDQGLSPQPIHILKGGMYDFYLLYYIHFTVKFQNIEAAINIYPA